MKPVMLKLDLIFSFHVWFVYSIKKHYSKDTNKNLINLYFALYSLFLFTGIISIKTLNKMQPDNNKARFDTINIK